MKLSLTDDEQDFVTEVREFLAQHLSQKITSAHRRNSGIFVDREIHQQWQSALTARGWGAPHWPQEYGGSNWSTTQHYLFSREYYRAGAPMLMPQGTMMLAPILLAFGNEQQKSYYLPRILSGEHFWCQGYSEPGAGSDLASLSLAAVRDGEDYILNGSKIWTTHAHYADHIFCLVKTDKSVKPQRGISFLLVRMDTPGIELRPIITMAGEHEVNQVFFDNVRVPQQNRVGEENAGWQYAKYLLEFERAGTFNCHRIRYDFVLLQELLQEYGSQVADFDIDHVIRRKVASIDIDLIALEFAELRLLGNSDTDGSSGSTASMLKLMTARLEQRINELAVDIVAYSGLGLQPLAEGQHYRENYLSSIVPRYLNNRAQSIFGGSDEVLLNIIARANLGL